VLQLAKSLCEHLGGGIGNEFFQLAIAKYLVMVQVPENTAFVFIPDSPEGVVNRAGGFF